MYNTARSKDYYYKRAYPGSEIYNSQFHRDLQGAIYHHHHHKMSTEKSSIAISQENIKKSKQKSPSPLLSSANNNNNSSSINNNNNNSSHQNNHSSSGNALNGNSTPENSPVAAAAAASAVAAVQNSLKRSSTSPIAATNGSIPSVTETLNGQSMLGSMFPTPPDINSVANLALMQQLHNSSLITGFPTGLDSLFRSTSAVPSFNPYSFGYPGIPSPSLFASSPSLTNGEPPAKKAFDPMHSLRDQLTGGAASLSSSASTNLTNSLLGASLPNQLGAGTLKSTSSSNCFSSSSSGSSSGSGSSSSKSQTPNQCQSSPGLSSQISAAAAVAAGSSNSSPPNRSQSALSSSSSSLGSKGSPTLLTTNAINTAVNNVLQSPVATTSNGLAGSSASPAASSVSSQGSSGNSSSGSNNATPSNANGTATPVSAKSEVESIRSLVKSYRESAAFLNRSADELEKLLNGASPTN